MVEQSLADPSPAPGHIERMQEVLRPVDRRQAHDGGVLHGHIDLFVAGGAEKVGSAVLLGRKPGEGLAEHPDIELRAGRQLLRGRPADRQPGPYACMVQPSTPMAACRRASERVGCGWQVRATSSEAARNSMAT